MSKTILVTGSSSGFGNLAVRTFAKQGYTVFASMRGVRDKNASFAAALKAWSEENNFSVEIIELDVTSDASVTAAIAEIGAKTHGMIDVLVNNAGISYVGLNETISASQADQIFQVNVIGTDRVTKAVLPLMRKQKNGLIMNVTSIQARNNMPITGAYTASKAAQDALSVSYYYELQDLGIDVAIIQPGGYPTTDIISKSMQPANPEVTAFYSSRMHKLKAMMDEMFTPGEDSPNPQEVADLMASIVAMPKGQRPLWNVVGASILEPIVTGINESTKGLVDASLNYFEI